MAMISTFKKAMPLFYYTHMMISWLCGQVKSLKEKSLEYKMCLGKLNISLSTKDIYIDRASLALTYTSLVTLVSCLNFLSQSCLICNLEMIILTCRTRVRIK